MRWPGRTLRERFIEKVDIGAEDECWLWEGSKSPSGYGQFYDGKTMRRAHRVAYELFIGEISAGMCVCHRCDVRHCVNPTHLYIGSQAMNLKDMVRKKRSKHGERNSFAKLKVKEVLKIRDMKRSKMAQKAIGEIFGVSQSGCIEDTTREDVVPCLSIVFLEHLK